MKRCFITISICLFSLAMYAQRYYEYIDSAEFYIGAKEWSKAEFFTKKALEAEPDNSNNSLLLSNLATIQRYQGKTAEAVKNYSIALYMTPNAVTLLKNRASLYLELDSVDLAYQDYDKIISLDNKEIESLYNHAMIAIGKKKFGICKDDLERIKAISPKSFYAINGYAVYDMIRGNYTQAVDGFGKIIKARPSIDAYINRAECYLAMKQLNNAEKDIHTALQLDDKRGSLYLLKAKLDKMRYDEMSVKKDLELAEKYGIDKDEIKKFLRQ